MTRPLAAFALSTAAGAGGVLAASRALGAEAPAPHPDAALLAREPQILALAREVERLREISWGLEEAAHAAAGKPDPDLRSGPEWDACRDRLDALLATNGYEAAEERLLAAEQALMDAVGALAALPARTLVGLRMKARVAEHGDCSFPLTIVTDLLAMVAAGSAGQARA